jgi:hypothetical protein
MKWKLAGAAALVAVVVMGMLTGTAAAASIPAFDPLTTNIPSLAWRGEELRLVKCVTNRDDGEALVSSAKSDWLGSRFSADWLVEDWSGYPFQPPQLEPSTVKFFWGNGEYYGDPCVKADFVSLKAGLAQIKLVITDNRSGDPLIKHQFLAGWLGLNTPSIREVSSTTSPGGGGVLGDPAGDGNFVAGGAPGRVQVTVTGNLPLGNNFTELGLPASINLPAESNGTSYWPALAQALATTSDPTPFYRDAPWRMWDIHDDDAATEGHVTVQPCNWTSPLTAIDAVDACQGADNFYGDAGYSRAFGDLSADPTWGPFDPLRPDETLLSDGKLDAGDVPMPSAIVDVSIAPNSGAAGDISGVGSLAVDSANGPIGVYKCLVYSRDHACNSKTGPHPPTTPNVVSSPLGPAAHNHYAPYYSRWIPATFAENSDGDIVKEASGNDGPPIGNNFPGYRGSGLYDYWQFADVLSTATPYPTHCLQRLDYGKPIYRQTPEGPQRVLVFSDEHGEAQVYFNPGTGFFFDNLVTPNENGGCDLRGVTTLGTANISAVARYPYQKTTDPDKPSATITKRVGSLFNKSVTCHPKAGLTGPEAGTSYICTASAIDIDGSPFVHEKVCFMTGGTGSEGMRSFPLGTPSSEEGLGRLCVWTDSNGNASVEVFGKCGTGNVIAEFVDEGIIRLATWTFGCPTGGGVTTTTTTTAAPGSAPGTAPGSAPLTPPVSQAVINNTLNKSASTTQSSAPTRVKAKATLVVARIVKTAFAKTRYVVVRVNGPAKTAKVKIVFVNRTGKAIGTVSRVVKTNALVRVPNLKMPKAAMSARVKLLS